MALSFFDVTGFDELWSTLPSNSLSKRSVRAFVHFIERKLGARVVYESSHIPFHDTELVPPCLLAEKLREKAVIHSYSPVSRAPDEIPFYEWSVRCAQDISIGEAMSGNGASLSSNREALTIALAEAVERHVWANRIDYFMDSIQATRTEIEHKRNFVAPERFAGFSINQRKSEKHLRLSPTQTYHWIRGYSWVSEKYIWLPAQTVSGNMNAPFAQEPLIRQRNTTGCSVYPTREGASLRGVLEIIERDAFMLTWLNQLSLPRFDLEKLSRESPSLARLVSLCAQYRLYPSAIRLLTDAPTYAVCVAIEDHSGIPPLFTFGLNAHSDPKKAVEGALLEGLRIRQLARGMRQRTETYPMKKREDIVHLERLLYWMEENRSKNLSFLVSGPIQTMKEAWEEDSEPQHLQRIIKWCKENKYECATVSMTKSLGNPTPWHIEQSVIPELQPLHLSEKIPHIGGSRLTEIPKRFGYTPRKEPYLADPHPFA